MVDQPRGKADRHQPSAEERLDSWKEIAVYLKRGPRTVQRWEREQGLPVHRLAHGKQGQVFAYKPELDAWWNSRGAALEKEAPEHRRSPAWLIGLAAALVLLLVAIAFLAGRQLWRPSTPPDSKVVLAVLPFENLSGDREQEYFSDGLTEEMITELGRLRSQRLSVIARSAVMRYKKKSKSVAEIARDLTADYLLEGSVRREGQRVRITAQLIRASDQTHLWAESYDRDLVGILALQGDVARAVAGQIRLALSAEEESRLARARPVVPEAHEAYLRGRFFWNKRTPEDLRKGLGYFQQALAKDPWFAPAYAGVADANILLEDYADVSPKEALPKAKAAAQRALEIDAGLAEAHASLAMVKFSYEWDWAGAERGFQRAIELSPSYATAHHWYALLLASLGRLEEALPEIRRAQRLEPFSASLKCAEAWRIHAAARRYDLALEELRTAGELDSNSYFPHNRRGLVYVLTGKHDEGIQELQRAVPPQGFSPHFLADLGTGYALAGRTAEAGNVLKTLQERSAQTYVSPYRLALIHAALGEKDAALKRLHQAFEERDIGMVQLKVEPRLDPVRQDPRFQDLLRRMNLPQ
jgi:TolB-like protein/tetratricopeptide (TPR) repeat protein